MVMMLQKATKLDSDEATALVKGLSDGYPVMRRQRPGDNQQPQPVPGKNQQTLLASINNSLPEDARPRLNRLLEAWGLRDPNAGMDPDALVIQMKTVREEMRFDKKAFSVPAGKTVIIVLENPDAMQHNLVVTKPRSMERVGKLADALITAKDGAEKNYVPESSDVLAATTLVNPNQTVRLRFKAPDQPGEYPYICTFPGHWRIMNGVMTVTGAAKVNTAK
jgi:azurin